MRGKGLLFIIGIIIIIGLVFGSKYNQLISLDENVGSQWAQVESQLKRRADMIPNLVETVKGYASHEREVLTEITEARSKVMGAQTINEHEEANQSLNAALTRLYAVAENYPELKANQNFSELQAEIAGTENRIATERMRYNETVQHYNTTVRRFPTNILANIMGFDRKAYFEINEKDAEVPKVEF